MDLLDYWEMDSSMKLLFCGLLVPQALSADFSRDTAVTVWMESLGLLGGGAGHCFGNGVQWPERMAMRVGKVPLGSRAARTAATPPAIAQHLGLSKAREARKGKSTPLARQALLPVSPELCSFPVY